MESSNGMSQGADTAPAGLTSSASPASAQAAPVSTPDERTFRQSEVNEVVKRAKHDAVESYRRLQAEQPQYAEQKFGSQPSDQRQLQQPNQGYYSQDEIRRLASEEVQRARAEFQKENQARMETEYANKVVQNFNAKVTSGRDKYQDFDQVTGDINLGKFPYVVQLLGEYVDNSADLLYELGKDRMKMANLEALAERSPQDAIKQAQRLSQSLKDNETARKTKMPNEPLSQLRPSNTGTDNGVMGVSDYRRKYKV